MKIRGIERTANVAWSPSSQYPIYLAAGTAAQQLDSSFSTSARLELYLFDLSHTSQSLEVAGSISTNDRLHKLVWSPGLVSSDLSLPDYLIGGAEQGRLYVWNPKSIIANEEPLVYLLDKHVGAVSALDVNPFQINLLASGAGDSEIFIWDLNNPEKPMAPGSKAQPCHDVVSVAWNRQVQHILGSSQGGNCIVWDLRKNEPIIKIRDSMSRLKCSPICWHPDVATQLCIASEDDHTPAIQLWDLRSATSPVKQLENHTRGTLSLAWCPQDSDLLLSCSKDNRILCWNPNSDHQTGEVVYELPNSNQWCFDVQWCPRNPGIISGCSFDGHISIYSITEGSEKPPDKVTEAFAVDGLVQTHHTHSSSILKNAPRWLKRPCGAQFGFGGKLITFTSSKVAGSSNQHTSELILSQVVTEPLLVNRSQDLEVALNTDNLFEYCSKKIAEIDGSGEGRMTSDNIEIWEFLQVSLEPGPQAKYLKLLGSDLIENERKGKFEDSLITNHITTEKLLSPTVTSNDLFDHTHKPLSIGVGSDVEGLITKALLRANFDEAVVVCLENGFLTEAMMLAFAGGHKLFLTTQQAILKKKNSPLHRLISSIVNHDIESVVKNCDINNWKEAFIIVLTHAFPQELASLSNMLGAKLEEANGSQFHTKAQLCYVVAGNTDKLISNWSKCTDANSYLELQEIIEKVTILQQSLQKSTSNCNDVNFHHGNLLVERLVKYAEILAEQGRAVVAMRYLFSLNDLASAILKDRFFNSLGLEYTSRFKAPAKPFNVVSIKPQLIHKKQSSARVPHQIHQQNQQMKAYPNVPFQASSTSPSGLYSGYPNNMPFASQQHFPANNPASSYSNNFPSIPASGLHGQVGQHQQVFRYPSHSAHSDVLYNPVLNVPASLSPNMLLPVEPPSAHQLNRPAAWNDPPSILSNTPSMSDQVPLSQPYQGQLYNPSEYQVQQPPQVPMPEEAGVVKQPVIQKEMPDEHKVIKEVFDKLHEKCLAQTTNLPTKRKLDDVSKKLEILYDLLCEGSISPPIVAGIHQIVCCIQQCDYNMAIAYHSQIVGMGSFSEISSFFLSIKVLIQAATQLNVYIK